MCGNGISVFDMAAITWPDTGRCFRTRVAIRFAHCDPAGIIFFPQYLVLFNGLVEDWFNHALRVSYAHMLGADRIGLPIVHLECDFRAITRMGESTHFDLQVERLGSRSITLLLRCMGSDAQLRAVARKVLVFTSLDTHQAMQVPAHIRDAIEHWAAAQAADLHPSLLSEKEA